MGAEVVKRLGTLEQRDTTIPFPVFKNANIIGWVFRTVQLPAMFLSNMGNTAVYPVVIPF